MQANSQVRAKTFGVPQLTLHATTSSTTTSTTTTTTTLPPSSQTFTPDKDTFVSAGAPSTNYGGGANLQVRSGARIAFTGFAVQGTAGVPKRAILRLRVGTDTDAGSDDGGAAYQASDDRQETTPDLEQLPGHARLGRFGNHWQRRRSEYQSDH